jgi:predicted TIM-barrel fold metal-dependent hydrolase
MRLEHFIAVKSRSELAGLEQESGISIHSLDDLVKAMRLVLEKYVKDGIIGIKNGLAYERTLQYDKVTKTEAETVFNRIASHLGEGPSWLEAKPLQDYMMHQSIRLAIEAGLPMQIHTGLQEGNENIITNSNPTFLVNLFIEYREAKFDLFHGGYPYIHEWATLAKNFANVYADMAWVHIISPEIGRQQLHELIETVPGNKIMAFGGDAITVEMAYAHSRMARQVVARVLSEKVDDGYLNEDEAIGLAGKVLRDNPTELFKIKLPKGG